MDYFSSKRYWNLVAPATSIVLRQLKCLIHDDESVFHPWPKHIVIDYHFVLEKVAIDDLITRFVQSPRQIADIFTKPLVKVSFHNLQDKLGVQSIISSDLKRGEEGNIKITTTPTKFSFFLGGTIDNRF